VRASPLFHVEVHTVNDEVILPHDDLTERAVLGCILLQPERAFEVADLPITAFYDSKHRVIFRAIAEVLVKHKTADLVLLFHHLIETNKIKEAGEAVYLERLVSDAWRSAHIEHYVSVLRDLESRRAAIVGSYEVQQAAKTEGVEQVQAMLHTLTKRLENSQRAALSRVNMMTLGDDLEPVPWMAVGWFGVGDSILLAGEWGTGKSVIALDLAISVAAGIPWMNRIPILKQCPVIYADEENNPRNARRRLRRMALGRGIEGDALSKLPISYLHANCLRLDSGRGKAMMREEIERTGAGLVVLDSLVRFGRLNQNHQDEVSNFFAEAVKPIMSDHGCTVLMIDHMRKPGEKDDKNDTAHRITGSQDKSAFADNIWTFHRVREEESGVLRASKNRWEDRLQLPVDTKWCVSEDQESAWIECKDATLSAEVELRELLSGAPSGMRASNLHEMMKLRSFSKNTTIRTLDRLVATGAVNKRKIGKAVTYWVGVLDPIGEP
jgi:hypothetical protein